MSKDRDAASTLTVLAALAGTIADAQGNDRIFAAVADAADSLIGHQLFTVMAFDASALQVQRLYSSNPGAYPPGGRKEKRDTQWGRHVLEEGRPFIGRNADDIRAHFDDHEVILGLGLASVLNVPIRIQRQTIGTMNLLHRAEYYGTTDLECGLLLAGQLAGPLCRASIERTS